MLHRILLIDWLFVQIFRRLMDERKKWHFLRLYPIYYLLYIWKFLLPIIYHTFYYMSLILDDV